MKTIGHKAGLLWVYMTAANAVEARTIARALVRERLAACVNILGPIQSIYRWKGAIEKGREVAFCAKTTRARFTALCKRVCALHSYEVPCIVAVPLAAGHPPFLGWIADSVRPASSAKAPGRSGAPALRGSARREG